MQYKIVNYIFFISIYFLFINISTGQQFIISGNTKIDNSNRHYEISDLFKATLHKCSDDFDGLIYRNDHNIASYKIENYNSIYINYLSDNCSIESKFFLKDIGDFISRVNIFDDEGNFYLSFKNKLNNKLTIHKSNFLSGISENFDLNITSKRGISFTKENILILRDFQNLEIYGWNFVLIKNIELPVPVLSILNINLDCESSKILFLSPDKSLETFNILKANPFVYNSDSILLLYEYNIHANTVKAYSPIIVLPQEILHDRIQISSSYEFNYIRKDCELYFTPDLNNDNSDFNFSYKKIICNEFSSSIVDKDCYLNSTENIDSILILLKSTNDGKLIFPNNDKLKTGHIKSNCYSIIPDKAIDVTSIQNYLKQIIYQLKNTSDQDTVNISFHIFSNGNSNTSGKSTLLFYNISIEREKICIDLDRKFRINIKGKDMSEGSFIFEPSCDFDAYSDSLIVLKNLKTNFLKLVANNSIGCKIEFNFELEDCDKNYITFPNVFTPNSDGLNDYFKPIIQDLGKSDIFLEIDVRIYNRMGCEIYKFNGLEESWDGKSSSTLVNSDTYMYTASALFNFDGKIIRKSYKGVVTLIR